MIEQKNIFYGFKNVSDPVEINFISTNQPI